MLCTVNYESVLATLHAHIALLRASLPLPAHHFEELASLAETRFRFRARQPPHAYVQALARDGAQPYPPERWVSGGALFRVRDEALVARVLAGFVPAEGRAFVSAKEHRAEVVGPDPVWETERWYGTRYFVRRMGEELLAKVCVAAVVNGQGRAGADGDRFLLLPSCAMRRQSRSSRCPPRTRSSQPTCRWTKKT